MNPQLYHVTVTELGTYTVTVPGDSAEDACTVATGILSEKSADLPTGVKATAREFAATAEPCVQPHRLFEVRATYSVDFSVTVPALNKAGAELNAQRYYAARPFPYDHAIHEDQVRWSYAQEVEQ